MRLLRVFCLCLLFSTVIFSQKVIIPLFETKSKPVLKFKSEIKVGGLSERIIAKRFLDDESKLLLVTSFGVQLWDVKTAGLLQSHPHEIAGLDKFDAACVLSPDSRKIIVLDTFNFSLGKLFFKKAKVPATVYSLDTGKPLAVLQRPEKSIRRAVWTPDGKTLVTYSNPFGSDYDMEICLWDGETLDFRGSLTANKWNYLTRNGEKLITTSGIVKNTLGYKFEKPDSINVWNVRTGQLEKTFPLTKEKSLKHIQITDDERFLLAENDKRIILLDLEKGVQQNFSAPDSMTLKEAQLSPDHRFLAAEKDKKILVWEVGGNSLPKFEVTPRAPVGKEKLSTELIGFDDNGKYVAISQLKYKKALLIFSIPVPEATEFYDLQTGQVNPDQKMFFSRRSSAISADEKYAITSGCERASVFDVEKQKELYSFPLQCKSYETTTSSTDSNGNTTYSTETYYYNDDIIRFHPKSDIGLVIKDKVLEVYSTDPDQRRLQLLYTPRALSKKSVSFPMSTGSLPELLTSLASQVRSFNPELDSSVAGFLFDGDYVFATSADEKSIFFWEVDKKLIE